eukprot:TRINITY_DN18653_c0_g7_i1.p1 TRINITY_DN18653_c0_g7~~TRINITY_DN18653_c0_g7_i1.p1  ORF type:complete len:172 (-),score=40.25 TRINITY_DN18653_c0_g7_i1:194-709(-)
MNSFTVTTLPNHSPSPFERVCQVQFEFSIAGIDTRTSILRFTIIDELENGCLFVHGESHLELESLIPSESCRARVYSFDCMIERTKSHSEVLTIFDVDFFPGKEASRFDKAFKTLIKKFLSSLIVDQAEKMVQAAIQINSKSHAIERNVPSKVMLYQYLESRCQQLRASLS